MVSLILSKNPHSDKLELGGFLDKIRDTMVAPELLYSMCVVPLTTDITAGTKNLAPCTKKSRDLFRHVGGQTNRLLRETVAASWDHERSVKQIFALIASLFRNKTIFIHRL